MKMYTKPEIEISVFATEDIITTSVQPDDSTTTTYGLTIGGANGKLTDSADGAIKFDDITLS